VRGSLKDVTLSPEQFNIQLERKVLKVLDGSKFRQNASPGYPQTSSLNSKITFPRRWREIRALLIASWYLPEWLRWEVILHFSVDFTYSLDVQSGGLDHSIEVLLLTTSREVMIKYLLQVSLLSARDLFGNVLGKDLESALRSIHFSENRKIRRKIRRRGYQDKGTWKTPDRWTERFDFSLTEEQLKREKMKLYLEFFYFTYLSKLR
jgi:hypothetical protein